MSGLFAAAFLRKIGWQVDVYERSPVELVGRGAGITTHPELIEALELSGAGTRDLGIMVERRIAIDRKGRVIADKPFPQMLTSWDRLQRLLRDTVPAAHYHLGCNFERAEQDGGDVVVHFTGGRRERADLLIGGDGIRSAVRGEVAPDIRPGYAGYYIWRGTANEADLAPETRASIFSHFTFHLPERQQVIGYPIAGFDNDLRCGKRRYNFIWYRVGDAAALRDMCVDADGRQHDHSVPPPLIRRDLLDALRRAGARARSSRRSTISPRRAWCSAGSSCWAMPPPVRVRIWASASPRRATMRARSPMRLPAMATSIARSRVTRRCARRWANVSCGMGGCSARISGSISRPRRIGPCGRRCRTIAPCWIGS